MVVKTRTEFQTEKKRLKVPKVEEFTISFTDGVSERLKVGIKKNHNFSIRVFVLRRSCHFNSPSGDSRYTVNSQGVALPSELCMNK